MYRETTSAVTGAVVWRASADREEPHRVLPDGCMDLLWTGGDLLVAGPDTAAHIVRWGPGRDVVGLRFAPGTAPGVLGLPAGELTDHRVPLADLWTPATVRRLTGQVGAAADPGAALERIALTRLAGAPPGDPLPATVLPALRAGTPVAAAAHAAGLSERHLRRRFHASFGYGPKTLVRILRMRDALTLARSGTPLAEAAARTGYADQPHFAREARSLAGVPITALLAADHPTAHR